MKGYKAFKKGLICDPTGNNPFQFAENTVFETDEEATPCHSGFHFCKNPLDVFDYYPLIDADGNMTEFAEVEALDEAVTDDNKKWCTKKLKVGARLSLGEFVKLSVDVTREIIRAEAKNKKKEDTLTKAGGDYSTLAGGDSSTLAGGKHSILVGDNGSRARGSLGSLIVLVARGWRDGEYVITDYKAALVDGETVKADTWYKLEGGELVEVSI